MFINWTEDGNEVSRGFSYWFTVSRNLVLVANFEKGVGPFNPDMTYGEFTDQRDGQKYKTIQIGTQTWMAENLKYLPTVSPSSEGSKTEPYYYVYRYEGTDVNAAKATGHFNTYGVLYNWNTALTACPPGWHLPSDAEWATLITYLDPSSKPADVVQSTIAGGKMKSTSSLWGDPNSSATNESGWTGLPGGFRRYFGGFSNLGHNGYWHEGSTHARGWSLHKGGGSVFRKGYDKDYGFSVRCLRD